MLNFSIQITVWFLSPDRTLTDTVLHEYEVFLIFFFLMGMENNAIYRAVAAYCILELFI